MRTEQKPVFELNGVSKSFFGIGVLHDISLHLHGGEVHCLLGENGAGKSTLIKIASGAYSSDQGTIVYQGEAVHHHYTPKWTRENGIITIYQEIDLVEDLSASENIFLGNEPLKAGGNIDWKKLKSKAKEIFAMMGVEIEMDKPVGELKIAHQQMVAIAKALSVESKVIIFDEPTTVFTGTEVELLFNIINKLKARGIAILYISHHLDEIFRIGDRITVLRDGRLIRTGPVNEFDKAGLIKAMVGREIDTSHKYGKAVSGEEMFRVKGLSRAGTIDDIHFHVCKGEIVAVAGIVGAGRTEMARLLVGADSPDRGEFLLDGRRVTIDSPRRALKLRVGLVPESRREEGIIPIRSVWENMAYSTIERTQSWGFVRWGSIKKRIHRLIHDLNVKPNNPNRQVKLLSGGNQQKTVLGKWLSAECDFLILDEPTRGVDVGARSEIYKLMQQWKKDGKAILMISSDLTEILTQADRILVMAQGRITGELACNEATEESILALALQFGGEQP